jgi:hypothetical protein
MCLIDSRQEARSARPSCTQSEDLNTNSVMALGAFAYRVRILKKKGSEQANITIPLPQWFLNPLCSSLCLQRFKHDVK